jgi:hypothetical protein
MPYIVNGDDPPNIYSCNMHIFFFQGITQKKMQGTDNFKILLLSDKEINEH